MIDIAATADFILEAFESLGHRIIPAGSLDARRVPGRAGTFVAVSESRELLLLLEVDNSVLVEERRLKALRVLSGDEFSIIEAATDRVIRRRFAVVALRSGHEDLASSFAVVAATLLATLAEVPTANEVIEFLDSLVDLVASRSVADATTIVGLWGELWMIASAADPALFAAAWHKNSMDRFDFSFAHARVEVKTTTSQDRVHDFGLDQLEAGDAKPLWIASLAIVSDPNGQTVLDLLHGLLDVLTGTLAARVSRIALEIVAGDIESVQDYAFAPVGAEPLLVFNSPSIPRVLVPVDAGISRVRFRINLDRVAPTARSSEHLASLLE